MIHGTINSASFFFKCHGVKKVEVGGGWVRSWFFLLLFYYLPPVGVWGNVRGSL